MSAEETAADLEPVVPDALTARRPRWWVRWLLLAVVVALVGVMGTRIATLTRERDDAVAAAKEAGVREIRSRQQADLRLLESELRTVDLLVLPEVDSLRASVAIVGVEHQGDTRTWLLLRAAGARAGVEYALTVEPCRPGSGFNPFTFRNVADDDGNVELVAQNVPVEYDAEELVLRLHEGTKPLIAVKGPLVAPDQVVTGNEALDCPA